MGNFYDKQQKWLYGVLVSPVSSTKRVNCIVTKSPYADNLSHYTDSNHKIKPKMKIFGINECQ